MQWYVDNEKVLKKNLEKNITKDAELVHEAMINAFIKVVDRIDKGIHIEKPTDYYFIASKFEYIYLQNKKRREQKARAGKFDDIPVMDNEWEVQEERIDRINELLKVIKERLELHFPVDECDIFLIYYRLKAEKAGVSYEKLAKITDRKVSDIANIIKRLKAFVREDAMIDYYLKKVNK